MADESDLPPNWREDLFSHIRAGGNILEWSRRSGVDTNIIYNRRKDPAFRARWDEAMAASGRTTGTQRVYPAGWQQRFIGYLRSGESVNDASKKCGLPFHVAHRERKRSSKFKHEWDLAMKSRQISSPSYIRKPIKVTHKYPKYLDPFEPNKP